MRRPSSILVGLLLVASVAACQHSQSDESANDSASSAPTASISPTSEGTPGAITSPSSGTTAASNPSPTGSPLAVADITFDDIAGIAEQRYIVDLARLGVFDRTSGHFDPAAPITRAVYVRWLVKANNAIWWDRPDLQIRLAEGPPATFPDVSAGNPNFAYIQGCDNSGIAIGFGDKYFHPDAPLTREQLLAIKESVDRGGFDQSYADLASGELHTANAGDLPSWKDRTQIKPEFRPLIATMNNDDEGSNRNPADLNTVGRTFGALAMLRPTFPVTRAEAAASLWKAGPHRKPVGSGLAPQLPRTAAEAIAQYDVPPSPSPSP